MYLLGSRSGVPACRIPRVTSSRRLHINSLDTTMAFDALPLDPTCVSTYDVSPAEAVQRANSSLAAGEACLCKMRLFQ